MEQYKASEGRHGGGNTKEVKTDDPGALKEKVLEAGLPQVEYLTGRFYFQAPGGQVWGIRPIREP